MKTIEKFHLKVADWSSEFFDLDTDDNVNLRHRMDYKNKTLIFSLSVINKPTEWTRGVYNRIKNMYVCFADYDKMMLKYVIGEQEQLQKIYDLGNVHIFQSSEKGFHAVSFCKMTAKEYNDFLDSSSVDEAFKHTPRMVSYRNWVLRNFKKGDTPRPKLITTLKGKTTREQSLAHWKYFSILYPEIKKYPLENSDNNEELEIVDYPTAQNI